jgi:FMN phosphatase YigB (HAD superfamily)
VVTRANQRFHLVKLPLGRCFVAIFLCAEVKKKTPEKFGAAVANILRLNFVATTWASKYITNSFRECRKARQAGW